MSKLKKFAKIAGIAAAGVGGAYALKKGHEYDKRKQEKMDRKDDHQELKKLERDGSPKAKASAKKYRQEKGIGPKGGKVKFIRVNGRIVPVKQK